MYGYNESSTASASSRLTRPKSFTNPLWTHSQRPWRKGWQLVCWTAVPVEARMCARKMGDSTWLATSRRLRSFHAGSMLWKTAGVWVFAPYQPPVRDTYTARRGVFPVHSDQLPVVAADHSERRPKRRWIDRPDLNTRMA